MRLADSPELRCSKCGYAFDSAVAGDEADVPEDGSLSICLACGHLQVYINDVTALRELTADEKGEVMTDPKVHAVIAYIMRGREQDPTWPTGVAT